MSTQNVSERHMRLMKTRLACYHAGPGPMCYLMMREALYIVEEDRLPSQRREITERFL